MTDMLESLLVRIRADTAEFERAMDAIPILTEASMGKMVGAVSVASAAVVAALAVIGTASVIQWAKFDDAMTKSLAIMEDVSPKMRKEMELTARQLAVTSSASAVEVATSYKYLASAGYDAAGAIKGIGVVQKFAAAGAYDMATATNYLTNTVAAFGLKTDDVDETIKNMTRVSDVFTHAANISNAEADQFAMALRGKLAGAAKQLGMTVEETVGYLSVMADKGIVAERAGERLTDTLIGLQESAGKNAEEWAAFGLRMFDARGKMLPLIDVVDQFQKATRKMTDEQRSQLYLALKLRDTTRAGIETFIGATDEVRRYQKELRNAGGATEEVAQKQLSSFSAQMAKLRNQVVEAQLVIGEKLVPVLRNLSDEFQRSYEASGGFKKDAEALGEILSTVLVVGFNAASYALWGFISVIQVGQSVLVTLAGILTFVAKVGQVTFTAFAAGLEQIWIWAKKIGEIFKNTWSNALDKPYLTMLKLKKTAFEVVVNANKLLGGKVETQYANYINATRAKMDAEIARAQASVNKNEATGIPEANASWAATKEAAAELEDFAESVRTGTDAFTRANKDIWDSIWERAAVGPMTLNSDGTVKGAPAVPEAPMKFSDLLSPDVVKAGKDFMGSLGVIGDTLKTAVVQPLVTFADRAEAAFMPWTRTPAYNPIMPKGAFSDEYDIDRPSFSRSGLGTGREDRIMQIQKESADNLKSIKDLLTKIEKKPSGFAE